MKKAQTRARGRRRRVRLTVTVDRDVVEVAKTRVKQGGVKSLSAWVEAAITQAARDDDLAELLAEMEAENPAPPEVRAWARRALGLDA